MADSQVKFTRAILTADSPTLATAIARFGEQEAAAQLRQGAAVLSSARTNATVEIATAQAQQILAEARRQAAEILQQSQEALAAKERDLAEREAKLKLAAMRVFEPCGDVSRRSPPAGLQARPNPGRLGGSRTADQQTCL